MSQTPLISVVMPAYNHELYVGKSVESVLSQSFEDIELIVIDDGSTDSTADVVNGYCNDKRLLYTRQENQDAYNALNAGMKKAKGAFIAIINSDDIYEPARLERLLDEHKRTGAQCLFTDVQPVDHAGVKITDPGHGWLIWHKKNRDFYFLHNDLYTAFLKGNFMVTTSNLFFSRAVYERIGDFAPLRYLHDYDYIFRIIMAFPGQVRYMHDQKLLQYRVHSANTLGQGAITAREQDRTLIKKYLLEGLPESNRAAVSTGVERLIELEHELMAERARLAGPSGEASGRSRYLSSLRDRLIKMFRL